QRPAQPALVRPRERVGLGTQVIAAEESPEHDGRHSTAACPRSGPGAPEKAPPRPGLLGFSPVGCRLVPGRRPRPRFRTLASRKPVGQVRRALIRFDIAGAIPAGSTITDVKLTLNLSQTVSFDTPVGLYRALRDWGEGTSDAGDPGGAGALSTPGDATWLHTFY